MPDLPNTSNVLDLQWLAPRQCKHPSKLDFVRKLNNLRCWPENVTRHTFRLTPSTNLVVEKCTGDTASYDPNLNGLAVHLDRVDGNYNVKEQILLPGDAPFSCIPSYKENLLNNLVVLLAPHHGSNTHFDENNVPEASKPKSKRDPTIVYTFGLKTDGARCYGHPCKDAIVGYRKKGWEKHRCTSGGFDEWPPESKAMGNPKRRQDIEEKFEEVETLECVSTASVGQERVIAMRRGDRNYQARSTKSLPNWMGGARLRLSTCDKADPQKAVSPWGEITFFQSEPQELKNLIFENMILEFQVDTAHCGTASFRGSFQDEGKILNMSLTWDDNKPEFKVIFEA